MFDTGGMELVKESEKKEQGGGAMDPFAAFFGGGGNQRGNRGNDANVDLSVSLDDMYNGNEISAEITRRVICRGAKINRSVENAPNVTDAQMKLRWLQELWGLGFRYNNNRRFHLSIDAKTSPLH